MIGAKQKINNALHFENNLDFLCLQELILKSDLKIKKSNNIIINLN